MSISPIAPGIDSGRAGLALLLVVAGAALVAAPSLASSPAPVVPSSQPSAAAAPLPEGDYVSGPVTSAIVTSTLHAAGFTDADIQAVNDSNQRHQRSHYDEAARRRSDGAAIDERQSSRDRLEGPVPPCRRPYARGRHAPAPSPTVSGGRETTLLIDVVQDLDPRSHRLRHPDGHLRVRPRSALAAAVHDVAGSRAVAGALRCAPAASPSRSLSAFASVSLIGQPAALSPAGLGPNVDAVDCPPDILEFALTEVTCGAITRAARSDDTGRATRFRCSSNERCHR